MGRKGWGPTLSPPNPPTREGVNASSRVSFYGRRFAAWACKVGQVAPKLLGDEVLEAVGAAGESVAVAIQLTAGGLPLLDFAELFLQSSQAVGAQGRRVIDLAQLVGTCGMGPAEDRRRFALLGPYREPRCPAIGTLPQFFPFRDVHGHPAHDGVAVDDSPLRPPFAGATRRRIFFVPHGSQGTRKPRKCRRESQGRAESRSAVYNRRQ